MKRKRMLVIEITALILVLTGCGAQDARRFTFSNRVHWGDSRQTVWMREGNTDILESVTDYTTLVYEDVEVNKCVANTLTFYFKDDALCAIVYRFTHPEALEANAFRMIGTLTRKYGEPRPSDESAAKTFLKSTGFDADLEWQTTSWAIHDRTSVYVLKDDSQLLVVYLQE